jgi:hypothetical protein
VDGGVDATRRGVLVLEWAGELVQEKYQEVVTGVLEEQWGGPEAAGCSGQDSGHHKHSRYEPAARAPPSSPPSSSLLPGSGSAPCA